MILVVDNYDSFVHNLARYIRELGEQTVVFRNDHLSVAECHLLKPRAIVLSPGPGKPEDAGICKELVRFSSNVPILGVCLGHQCIAEVYGGHTIGSKEPMHGRASEIFHDGTGVFRSLSSPLQAGRYHSLSVAVDDCPELLVQARTEDEEIMAFRHVTYPHHGVQFHPESLLTGQGKTMIKNFLHLTNARAF